MTNQMTYDAVAFRRILSDNFADDMDIFRATASTFVHAANERK